VDTQNPSTPALPPAAQRLRQGRIALAERAQAGDLAAYPKAGADLMDAYFKERLEEMAAVSPALFTQPLALMAVGGYGRSEFCPASDVDVIVLYAEGIPKSADELSRGIFHPLWDLGLDLGHGVRAMDDCLRLSREDTQVLTSLLDARLVAGDADLAARFRREFEAKVLSGRAGTFGQWVLEHNVGRRAQYGDASGLLEPELKNGLGGLRDVHQIRWLLHVAPEAAAPFTTGDMESLEADYRFVLAARTALHLAARRKSDTLNFDLQPQVARAMGFAGAEPGEGGRSSLELAMSTGIAVERFLSRLHQCMTRIRAMRQACWIEAFPPAEPCLPPKAQTPDGLVCGITGLSLVDEAAAAKDPALILELYVTAARLARPLTWSAVRATRAALADPERRARFADLPGILPALLEIFRASGQPTEISPPQAVPPKAKPGVLAGAIKRIFAPAPAPGAGPAGEVAPTPQESAPAVATALQSMLDTGLMAALIPEFAPVEHLVQFDDFHIHPVGKHTLEVVRTLAALRMGEASGMDGRLTRLAAGLANYDRLYLAALCHDLAKPSRDHSSDGAALATRLLTRLGADKASIADAAFLVRQHLLIPKIATRRDLADESVVTSVAESAGTVERLDMLLLLAAADSSSTGPRAWNPWTATLFFELAHKARKLLTDGPLAEPHAVARSRSAREEALALAIRRAETGPEDDREPLDAEYAAKCLERMPARAFLVLDAATIVRHMRLARRFQASLDEDMVRKPSGKAGIGVCEIDAVAMPHGRAFQVSMAAMDQPGLFAVMAGVLALHDLNILSAEVLTWTGGLALDVFVVEEPGEGIYLDDLWQRLRRAVGYALTGKLSLEYRLEQKRSSPLALPSRAPKSRRKVRVDNEGSDFYTLVEVAAPDRLGLLHDLARKLAESQVQIHLARIATSAGRIHDTFYVRDQEGMKITDPQRAEAVKKALLALAK
jgi:[protein-PII] uridylyltransferase